MHLTLQLSLTLAPGVPVQRGTGTLTATPATPAATPCRDPCCSVTVFPLTE